MELGLSASTRDAILLAEMITARSIGIALWIGLAILTITLLILMRTRWGQVKPMSKCVGLSIFAHLLLGCYAYSTQLFFEAPSFSSSTPMQVTFADSDSEDLDNLMEEEEVAPWNRFGGDVDVKPDMVSPAAPLVSEAIQPLTRPSQEIGGRIEETQLTDESITSEVERPSVDFAIRDGQRIGNSATTATEIERPSAPKRVQQEMFAPSVNSLARIDSFPSELPVRSEKLDGPIANEIKELDARLQKLAEPALQAATSQTPAGAEDLKEVDVPTEQVNPAGPAEKVASDEPRVSDDSPDLDDPAKSVSAVPSQFASAVVTAAALPSRRRLGDGQELPSVYRARLPEKRVEIAKNNGGSDRTEEAVNRALDYLARNQGSDGRWDADRFAAGRETKANLHDRQGAGAFADTGVTGLAVLSFLAAGHTHLEGEYHVVVQRGLEFILRSQGPNGNLSGDAKLFASMYCHGMASLAISEAYALTGDHRLRPYVQRAIDFSVASQHPHSGGWRYLPGDLGDMSQFGWQVMAVKSAQMAGIDVPPLTLNLMARFLEGCTSGNHRGLASYRPRERTSPAMTAEALTCRYFMDQTVSDEQALEATTLVLTDLPNPEGQANLYYWYYGTLATFHSQNEHWQVWNQALKEAVLSKQRQDGDLAGSWNPDSLWGGYGGRIYSTAIATLSLEVYYRYLPVFKADK